MITDPVFYALAVPAALLAGISKGGFGSGVVVMAVPMLSLLMPVPMAAAIMLPILMLTDFINLWVYRRDWNWPDLKYLMPGAVIGTALGWAGFHFLTEGGMRLMVGVIAIVFTLDHWLPLRPKTGGARPPGPRGAVWGTVGAFTSFFAHAGGPPIQVYMMPRGLPKRTYVGTFALYFWAVNMMKAPAYWGLEQFTTEVLATSLVLMPLAPVGIRIGLWCQNRLSDRVFYGVCYVFLFLTGIKLTWDGVTSMIG
ncbi:MAG: hypothetical protein COW30_02930 [Rhodospirillales bacterium CG15_BIG_FIL_POST_REV_8_21_14_020_66_15]|nr:MAG: hypothetical protein COW30_02930 [Rhodospirillales bacterium CG15_BIG_FIL_POST_REV_8_21_14_020_66_15]